MDPNVNFPLYSPIKKYGNLEYFLCLCKEDKEFCGKSLDSFASLIEHFKTHNLPLLPAIDYCLQCEIVFQSKLDAIEHYLSKSASYENKKLMLEPDTENLDSWLSPLFESIKLVRKKVMHKLLFEVESGADSDEDDPLIFDL